MTCFDDETVLGLVEGRLDAAALAAADEHLDDCVTCRALVTQLARGTGEPASAVDRVLERGHTLGRYVIGDVLGAGAWGRVYSAWEPELDRRVAIKVLRDRASHDRVLREAQAMAKLDHPNVIGVHEVGTADDAVYVAMELVDGQTLRAWAKDTRTWREVARAIADTARGLAAVHAAGLVHRDVKPDNIIIGTDGRARLGDFGLARTSPDPAEVGAIDAKTKGAGTPVYMAPELLDGATATPASDQFALGVTAYEVLAQRRPFAGDTLKALAAAMARAPAAPRSGRAWLDAAIVRCLARDPATRHASCTALADAIDRGLARRKPTAIVAGIAAAAVLASGATFLATRRPTVAACTLDPEIIDPAVVPGYGADVAAAIARWNAGYTDARASGCARPIANACLAARGAELRALLAAPKPDDSTDSAIARTVRLIDAIDAIPPSDCLADADGRDPVPVAHPSGPDALPNMRIPILANVTRDLPAIRAAVALGDVRGLERRIASLVASARETDYEPAIAEVLLVAADAARATSKLDDAGKLATEAFSAALRGHAAQLVAEAAVARVTIAGERRELAVADALADVAEAAVAAAHHPSHLAAQLARQHALVAYNLGDLGTARKILLDAYPLQNEPIASADRAALESALGSVARAAGDLDEADRRHGAALDLDRARHPTGPDVARDLHNLAGVARLRGELDRATQLYTEALAIEIALRGTTSVAAALTHNSLGLVALARGDLATAETELQTAAPILEAAHHGDLAFVDHNLGLVAAANGEHGRALTFYARAAELYASTIGDTAPAAIRLNLDRARALVAAHSVDQARIALQHAIELVDRSADRASVAWIADDSRALLDTLAAKPAPVVAKAAPRPIVVEPTPADAARPNPDQIRAPTTVVPTPPRPRDVGVYGSSQTW